MKIGDIVTVSGKISCFRLMDKRVAIHQVCHARKCVYLGKTTLQTGTVINDFDNPPYLSVEQLIPALVFQPLQQTGQRYLKPFYAKAEDVEQEDDSPKYVDSLTTISRIDKANPRVEITLSEVE